MSHNLFRISSYKDYLNEQLDNPPFGGRGARSRLAEATGCQTAFIAQVLRGSQHFGPEQVEKINQFLSHSDSEAIYFYLLVQRDRASTDELRARLNKQLNAIKKDSEELRTRFKVKEQLNDRDLAHFYSSWIYAAVHVCLSIPGLQNLEEIAQKLSLDKKTVKEAVDFLLGCGMLSKTKNGYKIGVARTHLGSRAPLIKLHHMNWRLQAMKSIDQLKADHLHFSSVWSLSKQDITSFRKEILALLDKFNQAVSSSKEEDVVCFNLDFYGF